MSSVVGQGITPDPICEIFQKASDTHRYETRYAMEDDFHKIAIKKEITKTAISIVALSSGIIYQDWRERLLPWIYSRNDFRSCLQVSMKTLPFQSFFCHLFSRVGGFCFIYNYLIGYLYRFLFHILVGFQNIVFCK